MEKKVSLKSLSKFALSNVALFLPIKTAFQVRQVNKTFDEAVYIGINCLYYDIQDQAARFEYIMETQFDSDTRSEHKTLRANELLINQVLQQSIQNAGQGDNLFKNFKELSYLKKPNHLIEKPIIAVLILLNKCPKIKAEVDFMKKEDIDEIWVKIRDNLKNKQFLNQLKEFDIRTISDPQIKQIQSLFANDPWMTVSWIRRESVFALNLFIWVAKIIEYIQVAAKLSKLGVKVIEEKRDQCLKIKSDLDKIKEMKEIFMKIKDPQHQTEKKSLKNGHKKSKSISQDAANSSKTPKN
ncbi:UNKNOWN [Stylonychia lemnae]|uniref:Uncharacterized protein n=1 Tax=Stylonychia lemnae TaxID=5949 RepID=A0A078A6C1_STYLE|nr:UNKNOWN [Stylonychia lemnae]|eukprot:CDW77406.1 UNKNOWN [Stylonychia lemnae]